MRSALPDMALMLTDVLVVVRPPQAHGHDPRQRRTLDDEPDVERAYARAVETIAEVRARARRPGPAPGEPPAPAARRPTFESNMPREQFEAMVARIIEYIHAGDAFQVVPSQRWSAPVPVEAFSIYRGLRAVNPSPYMYFLDFGDFQIAGASPEPLLTVTGRHVVDAPDRRHAPARRERRGGPRGSPRSCSPTRRSAPST